MANGISSCDIQIALNQKLRFAKIGGRPLYPDKFACRIRLTAITNMTALMQNKLHIISIPYFNNSSDWFQQIRHLKQPLWLDSGIPEKGYGRFDILSAEPSTSFTATSGITRIYDAEGKKIDESNGDTFTLLEQYFSPLFISEKTSSTLPFCGGLMGYFGYDLNRQLEKIPESIAQDSSLPDLCVGIYPWAIIQDHQLKQSWLVKNSAINASYNFLEIDNICAHSIKNSMFHDLKPFQEKNKNTFKINKFKSNINANQYANSIATIKDYLAAGDCYQVNFAQRFSAEYSGDPFIAYQLLRQALPSPFSAYMEIDTQRAALCLSPERFIRIEDRLVETQPIKGTIKRGSSPEEDKNNADWLKNSAKNRAENVMIVDLLRNDLSKNCTQVSVPKLCELQSFANVHHLVSTVHGQLLENSNPIKLLRDCFPGGSITGTPKIRAMEIIEELETTRRSVYCGSLGYVSVHGRMDTNIAIRTLVCDQNKIHCWGGGGIVMDSDSQQEYQESIDKIKLLMQTLETEFGGK
jgi:para-aminobenzoate synthetase component I